MLKLKAFLKKYEKQLSNKSEIAGRINQKKVELAWSALEQLTIHMQALTDTNHEFKQSLTHLIEKLENYKKQIESGEPPQWKPNTENKAITTILDDEEAAIEIFRRLLADNYEPPIHNLILLQMYLQAIWLYYFYLEKQINIPAISQIIDCVAIKIIGLTMYGVSTIKKKGLDMDRGKRISRGKHWMRDEFKPIAEKRLKEIKSENPKISNERVANIILFELKTQYGINAPQSLKTIRRWLFKEK